MEHIKSPSVLPSSDEAWSYLRGRTSVVRQAKAVFAADGRAYDPNEKHSDYSTKTYPNRTVVVLQTLTQDNEYEYRVGIVTRADFTQGLRRQAKGSGIYLNRQVAEKCFLGEPYKEKVDALQAANKLTHQDHVDCGVKVISYIGQFPGIYRS